ncbi:MAG: hypothetical protein ACR2LS_06275 [Thermomicrobiales bacterium]
MDDQSTWSCEEGADVVRTVKPTTRWGYAGILAAMLLLAGGAILGADSIRRVQSNPVLGTPAPLATDLSDTERAFASYLEPRLAALQRESLILAELGASRGRDAVALLEGQRHVETLIADISRFIETNGVPDRFQNSTTQFATGAREARQSIRDGRAALTRMDWDALANEVERFTGAAARFESASQSLSQAAGQVSERIALGPMVSPWLSSRPSML